MAAQVTGDRLASLLRSIAQLLLGAHEATHGRAFAMLGDDAEKSTPGSDERQDLVRRILALYGGMGSFQDLVLQDARGALPEQRELEILRNELFEEARGALR